ncbi:MAG: hypothetical protein CR971_01740 [candidate division SR1 bacterium]|nr:MAG: hypothetical protein CR971_01740 [candidate division SR1 bacterium]
METKDNVIEKGESIDLKIEKQEDLEEQERVKKEQKEKRQDLKNILSDTGIPKSKWGMFIRLYEKISDVERGGGETLFIMRIFKILSKENFIPMRI